jgi:hypothetical protein
MRDGKARHSSPEGLQVSESELEGIEPVSWVRIQLLPPSLDSSWEMALSPGRKPKAKIVPRAETAAAKISTGTCRTTQEAPLLELTPTLVQSAKSCKPSPDATT